MDGFELLQVSFQCRKWTIVIPGGHEARHNIRPASPRRVDWRQAVIGSGEYMALLQCTGTQPLRSSNPTPPPGKGGGHNLEDRWHHRLIASCFSKILLEVWLDVKWSYVRSISLHRLSIFINEEFGEIPFDEIS